MTAGEYGTGYADRLGNSAWRWIALFWARSAGGQCVRWCGGCRYCPDPLGFVLAEKGDGLPAARRLASPAGGGGTALAVTERAFFPLPTPSHVVALSVGFAASSPRGRAKLGAFRSWVRFGLVHTFRDVSPFLIRLAWRRATFPPGEGFLGRWNPVGAEENPRWRRGHTPALRKVCPFCQSY